jgi:hypothetical protein
MVTMHTCIVTVQTCKASEQTCLVTVQTCNVNEQTCTEAMQVCKMSHFKTLRSKTEQTGLFEVVQFLKMDFCVHDDCPSGNWRKWFSHRPVEKHG